MYSIKSRLLFLIIFPLIMISCDEITQDAEPEPLEFATEPSDDLSQLVQEAPSDFTWEYYSENIILTEQSGNSWEGELALSGFQVLNGEIVDRTTTESFEANAQLLSNGFITKELQSVVDLISHNWGEFRKMKSMANLFELKWQNANFKGPLKLWNPGNHYSPSEIENAILSEIDLREDETLFVVYTELASHSTEREQKTQPFGLLMRLDD